MKVKDGYPFVSIVMPIKNEGHYLARSLDSIVKQDYPSGRYEVIIVDGGSNDETLEIAAEYQEGHSHVKVLSFPEGLNCPASMNAGIREAKGDIVIKVDGHGYIGSEDFISLNVETLMRDRSVGCVGGTIVQQSENIVEQSNGFARMSRAGAGSGPYSINESGRKEVYTLQCGAYRRDILDEVGLFDEQLQFGEDEELNWRVRRAGYSIVYDPRIMFYYIPRSSFHGLFKQYYNYGCARIKVIGKHPDFFKLKHIVPSCLFLSLLVSFFLGFINKIFFSLFFIVLVSYIFLLGGVALKIGIRNGFKFSPLVMISFACMHFGYGLGFLKGIVKSAFRKE